jgi:hypothetical protein
MSRTFAWGITIVLALGALLAGIPALAQAPPPPPVWPSPSLAWAGTTNYVGKGVNPSSGLPNTAYTFAIKYTHPDGTPPQYVRLNLTMPGGVVASGSPYTLTLASGTDYTVGVIYSVTLVLSKIGNYKYQFTASDGGAMVTFPTAAMTGPLVDTPPTLSWTGQPGYTTCGISPTYGPPGTTITFAVRYTDPDGAAKSVSVEIWGPGGRIEIAGSPFLMTAVAGTHNWKDGVIFTMALDLTAVGTYQYRFIGTDGYAYAYLPSATTRMNGPYGTAPPASPAAEPAPAQVPDDPAPADVPDPAPDGSQ